MLKHVPPHPYPLGNVSKHRSLATICVGGPKQYNIPYTHGSLSLNGSLALLALDLPRSDRERSILPALIDSHRARPEANISESTIHFYCKEPHSTAKLLPFFCNEPHTTYLKVGRPAVLRGGEHAVRVSHAPCGSSR